MASKWKICKWGDLVELKYGKGLRNYQNVKGDFPVFGTNGQVGWHTQPLCTNPGVIIGRKGAYRGVHYSNKPFFVIDTAFYVNPKSDIDLKWAYYSLTTAGINNMDSGSAIPSTSRDSFYQLPALLPPLPEQRRIAGILGTLDDKIELNRQMNEILEAIAQALFKSWFIDFDPVIDRALAARKEIPEALQKKAAFRQTLGNQRKSLPQEIESLFPDEFLESELGWIPKGWVITSLSNLTTELRRGISPKYCEEEGIRVVNQRCIRNHEINWNCARRHDTTKKKINERLLQPGDLLINSTGVGTLGRMAPVVALEEPAVADSHITIVRPDPKIYEPFLFARLMLTLEPLVESMGEGSTGQTELNRSNLGNQIVVVPPKTIQEAVVAYFRGFSEQVSINCRNIQTLSVLRDTLLPKLISGEIRVSETADILAEAIHE